MLKKCLAGFAALFGLMAVAAAARADSPADLRGIALAPGSDEGVAWSEKEIRSLDGARAYLPGAGAVAAVTLTADGTVFAIRGSNRFGVAARDRAAAWRPTPVSGKTRGFIVIADRVAWFVSNKKDEWLVMTADQGRHWTVQTLPFVDHGRLQLLADGVLELAGYMENCHSGDYSVRYRGRIGSNRWRELGTDSETAFGEQTHFGSWASDDGVPFPPAVGSLNGKPIDFLIAPADDEKKEPARLLGRPGGESADRVLDAHVPDGLTLITSDTHGRPLGLTSDNVWRWSKATGWQALRPRR